MELVTRYSEECWKCGIELLEEDRFSTHCPRCACVLADRPIDLSTTSEEWLNAKRSWTAATDLALIWSNWAKAFRRLMDERMEPDYSLIHEFATEVRELSFPYIGRLRKEGVLNKDCLGFLKETLNDLTQMLLSTCQQLESIMLLTGQWSEFDEETKKEWLTQLGFTNKLLSAVTAEQKRIE